MLLSVTTYAFAAFFTKTYLESLNAFNSRNTQKQYVEDDAGQRHYGAVRGEEGCDRDRHACLERSTPAHSLRYEWRFGVPFSFRETFLDTPIVA